MLPAQRLLLMGRSGLVSAATSVLGTTPLHYWDFTTDRALFAGKDVGGVTSTPGWSFTRASTGYANQTPNAEFGSQNLALRSQDWSVSPWTTIVGGTSTANAGTAPDGTTTATRFTFSTQYSVRGQNITTTDGTTYVWSFWAKLESGNTALTFFHDQSASGNYNATPFTVTTTWTRYSITCLGRTGGGLVVAGIQDRNASGQGSILVWGAQFETGTTPTTYKPTTTVAVTDVSGPPLVSFGSGVLRRTNKGALIEGAGTNIVLQSQTFDNASWAKTRSTVTANAIAAPDGTTTADAFVEDTTGSASHELVQAITKAASAIAYTHSVYVKAGGRNWICITIWDGVANGNRFWFNVNTGAVGSTATFGTPFTSTSYSIQSLGGGWYRCTVSFTTNTATNLTATYYSTDADSSFTPTTALNAVGLYLWGAQIEAQGRASSYVPTTTASATRAADIPQVASLGVAYPASVYVEGERVVDTGTLEIPLQIDDISNNNAVAMFLTAADIAACNITTGGVAQAALTVAGAIAVGTPYKMAARVQTNDANMAHGGTLGTQDTLVTLPATSTRLQIGRSDFPPFGYIRRIAIFNSALNDAALQRAST